ncbi:hypothetical protein [Paenibacillus dendrobii]|nr:hypothetical protein [Paenibacillus dendrobii]
MRIMTVLRGKDYDLTPCEHGLLHRRRMAPDLTAATVPPMSGQT